MKKKRFLSIDYSKPGKGVKKGESKLFTFWNFFPLLKRKFWGLFKTNLLWLVIMWPLLVGFFALSGKFDFSYSASVDPIWSALSGIETAGGMSPQLSVLMGVFGSRATMTYPGPIAKILYGITALAVFAFGPANTGMAYILRGYTKEEYVDMPSDFFTAIKKNFGQSLFLGLIDIIIMVMIAFDLVFFLTNSQDFVFSVFFFICLIMGIIYLMARSYIYLLLITFKLPLRKILKNSFIFALVGFKRNLAGLFGSLLVIIINLILYIYIMPLGGIMPFFITIALTNFITAYAAWPNIKKIMIDPYYKENTSSVGNDEDAVFTDRG